MAITGQRWLQLTRAEHLEVCAHALHRIRERAGRWLNEEQAIELFLSARHVRPDDLLLLGYRPAYHRRLRGGQKSWYFRIVVEGRELIAVIGQQGDGDFAWVTTYGRDAQTDQLCALSSGPHAMSA